MGELGEEGIPPEDVELGFFVSGELCFVCLMGLFEATHFLAMELASFAWVGVSLVGATILMSTR